MRVCRRTAVFLWNPMCLMAGNKQIQINKAKIIIWKTIKWGACFHSSHLPLPASSHFLHISISLSVQWGWRLIPVAVSSQQSQWGRSKDRLSPTPAALPLAEINPETVPSVCNGFTCPVENNPSVPIKTTASAISLLLYISVGNSFLFSSDMDAKTIFQFTCLR